MMSVTSAVASADTVALSIGPDPLEEVPLPVTTTWSSSDEGPALRVTVKDNVGLGCGASYAIDRANSSDLVHTRLRNELPPNGSKTVTYSENAPGQHVLCAYLQSDGDGDVAPTAVAGPLLVSFRAAAGTIALSPPARVDAGQKVYVPINATAELARAVFLTVKPAGGRPCEATYELDKANSTDIATQPRSVQGTGTVTAIWTSPERDGVYLLCAYLQEDSGSTAVVAAAQAQIRVGPDPCESARVRMGAATSALRTAETSVKRHRQDYKRYRKLARRAHGARRKSRLRRARREYSRYRSAIRRRAQARRNFDGAQIQASSQCPAG